MEGLSDDFAKAFGHLVYQSANVETGLKVCLAGMIDIRPIHVLALAEPYTGPQLRQVVKSLAKSSHWPDGALEHLVELIGRSKAHKNLRNHIAHSRWTKGTREGSIKPMGMKINNEKIQTFGHKDEEEDWLPSEIMDAAEELRVFCGDLLAFNDKFGLTERLEKRLPKTDTLSSGEAKPSP